MSKKLNYQINNNKEEIKNQNEQDSLYQLDVQLLSSLKSLPGKIIPLDNKINQESNNNKENNKDFNGKDTYNIINKKDSDNNINSLYNNDKMSLSNNILNNNFTTNNYFVNGGYNNINLNDYQRNNSGLIQNSFPAYDNQLLLSGSKHQSLLSFKADIKNDNNLWSDIKITQNSFTHNILFYNNENYSSKENINKNNVLNNNKFSQLSYQFSNIINDELIKKKKSTSIVLRKNSFHNDKNINKIEKNEIKNKENYINVNEEEKIEDNNNKNKKIFFNIENYYEDEDYSNNNTNNGNKKLFNCYLKKKKKRKKISKVNEYKCNHPKCEFSYKTLKQLQNHHFKMTQECQMDSVQIIKLIHDTKNILKNIIKHNNKKIEKYEKLYDNFVNKISLKNYFEFIAGTHFNDNV